MLLTFIATRIAQSFIVWFFMYVKSKDGITKIFYLWIINCLSYFMLLFIVLKCGRGRGQKCLNKLIKLVVLLFYKMLKYLTIKYIRHCGTLSTYISRTLSSTTQLSFITSHCSHNDTVCLSVPVYRSRRLFVLGISSIVSLFIKSHKWIESFYFTIWLW